MSDEALIESLVEASVGQDFRLTVWEADFIDSISDLEELSEGQREKALEILEKLGG